MYEKRIVLFLDIMGFKKQLAQPERLRKAVTDLKIILEPSEAEKRHAKFDVIQFSDLIVVALKTEYMSTAGMFVLRLMARVNALISESQIPVRGALVAGDFYYQDKVLISPALVEAYELESKFARYPRILIAKSFIDHSRQLNPGTLDVGQSERDLESISLIDHDGSRFLNYLHSAGFSFTASGELPGVNITAKANHLRAHRWFILNSLERSANDASIREKYIWLGNYHNRYLSLDSDLSNEAKQTLAIDSHLLVLDR